MNEETNKPGVALLGLPVDGMSTFMRGPANAPAAIREVFADDCSNSYAENGLDLGNHPRFFDAGDLSLTEGEAMVDQIDAGVSSLLESGHRTLSLGGDHAVTYPVVRAYAKHFPKLTILHFDAHPDLYDHYNGNRYANACPFARIMEAGLASRLVQIGIRTLNDHQREQAERFGVEIIEMRHFRDDLKLDLQGPLYISLDLDALDPAFAPGVSHHEPGGLSTRQILDIIQNIKAPVVGADIVEYNPSQDLVKMTARVAAKLIKEIGASMIQSLPEIDP